ncbi:lipopolysaccharide transport periplasmic protein LptA [Gammaproteobacteria bacterium AS21]|jgi:lipopolysaccharide export system protein LptA
MLTSKNDVPKLLDKITKKANQGILFLSPLAVIHNLYSMRPKSIAAICSIALLISPLSYALPDDREKPMDASANNATLDDATGLTTLTGDVKVVQGSMNITASKLVIYKDKNGDVSKMIATGNPAFFSQQQQANQPVSKAWGSTMNYSVTKQTVTITGNARVEQLKDKFTGQKIVYHMDKALVQATGGKQRVKMILQPKGNN